MEQRWRETLLIRPLKWFVGRKVPHWISVVLGGAARAELRTPFSRGHARGNCHGVLKRSHDPTGDSLRFGEHGRPYIPHTSIGAPFIDSLRWNTSSFQDG